ncbi:MAG: hypothetical protein ACTSRE_00865 [Promethearchaeota archaeon]
MPKMKKEPRNVLTIILILTGITYIPTFTLPVVLGMKIDPDKNYTATHSKEQGYYRLHVKKGEYYAFTIQWDHYTDPTVDMYTSTLKLYGIHRYSSSEIFIRFKAKHSGFYYVTIDFSKGDTFRLNLDFVILSSNSVLSTPAGAHPII